RRRYSHADPFGAGLADLARARLVRASRARRRGLAGARALQPLPRRQRGRGLCWPRARRLDRGARARTGRRRREGALLARSRARPRRRMRLRRRGALVLLALSLAGCGGADHAGSVAQQAIVAQAPLTPVAVAPSPPPVFHWTVRVDGRPRSIAAENAAPGTSAWRLPGPGELIGGEARGPIAGYVARDVVAAGQTERVYVSAPRARSFSLRVYRMGWYGGKGGRLVLVSGRLQALDQPPCTHRSSTGLTECAWYPD